MKSSIIIAGVVAIASAALIYNFVSSDSDNFVSNHKNQLLNSSQENSKTEEYEAEVLAPTGLSKLVYESQNINTGVIGIDAETNIDDPHDNTFHVYLDGEVESGRQAWLEYDLYGAEDYTSVSRVINDQVAIGGAFVKLSNEWSVQSEKIDASQLHKGDNIVRFSIPGNQDFNYTVKNVRIRFDESVDMSRKIVLNQPMSKSYYNRYGYISGFVSGNGSENAKIYANGKLVRSNQAIFEGIVDQIALNESDWKAVVTAVFADGQIISDTARFCNPSVCDFSNDISSDIAYNETTVSAQLPVHMNVPGFELNGEPGSVTTKVKMSVTGLRSQDMALPRLSMVNVTGASNGFRCLPHGNLFAKEVEVRIKYDTARIPQGYGPKDIRTFYYDESQNDWVMLQYDTVDIASCEIVSHTNHFTDFINAILKTPESPQTQAFTPTSMKDMKFADPIAHINMMSPPQANNSGTANMSYPIQVPAGRQGMQPQLAITYNSEGGNGWLGVGWGMNTPSISVETRWGVPTYSSTNESEEYLVNGQQIVELVITANDTTRLPQIHQASYRSRNSAAEVIYSYRVEGAFDRIIRHGTNPNNYWWEVVDKQGTRYFYGKYSSDAGVNPNCVLSDASGNVAHWALAEVRDQYGNYIKYNYDVPTFTGTPGYGGKQIYPESIIYSGNGTTDGKYSVDFQYINRNDYIISGNYGFLQVTGRLLQGIIVKYEDENIRAYYLKYKDGAYDKNVICAISDITDMTALGQVAELTCETLAKINLHGVKTHSFEYYEEEGVEFNSTPVTILTSSDYQESVLYGAYTDPEEQSLGKSTGFNIGGGGSLSVGIGFGPNKKNTIGGNLSFSFGTMKDKVTFMDINGDGITDKVFKDGSLYYCYEGELNGNNQLMFDDTATFLSGLSSLNRNQSKTAAFGGELTLDLVAVKGSASYTHSKTKQTTKSYFADVNADGYVDYINEANVYFNKPTPANDAAFYSEDCNSTTQYFAEDSCYYIIHDGEIDSAFYELDEENDMYYRRDPVKVWIAHEPTKAWLRNYIRRNTLSSNLNYGQVKYSIQLNDSIIYCDSIEPNDTSLHFANICAIPMNKGDKLYFRLHSSDKIGADDVFWDPIITDYTGDCGEYVSTVDADEKYLDIFKYSDDWVLSDKSYFTAPLNGIVKVSGSITSPPQSDSLNFVMIHNQLSLSNTNFVDGQPFSIQILDTVSVSEGDSILLKLLSNSNVNWSDIDYNFRIQYLQADSFDIDTTNPFYSIEQYPSLDMSIFPNRIVKSIPIWMDAGVHSWCPKLIFDTIPGLNGKVVLTAKTSRKLLDEKELIVQNGIVTGIPDSNRLLLSLDSVDTVYFDYYTVDMELESHLIESRVYSPGFSKMTPIRDAGFHTIYPDSMRKFGNLYMGWGQFSYYDSSNTSSCLDPIDESLLALSNLTIDTNALGQFPFSSIDTTYTMAQMDNIFSSYEIPDIYSMPFAPMTADCEHSRWIDFCTSAYCKDSLMGSMPGFGSIYSSLIDTSLFESDDLPFVDFDSPVPAPGNCGASRVIYKRSVNKDNSFSWSAGTGFSNFSSTMNFSENFGINDFMDLNGDRYPDLIDYRLIQYTSAQGGLSTKIVYLPEEYTSHGSGTGNGASFGIRGIKMKSTSVGQSSKGKAKNIDGSFGISGYSGSSEVDYTFADVNGDGLPDKVFESSGAVSMNIGYGFLAPEQWGSIAISNSISSSVSANIGLSMFHRTNYSWSGGIGGSKNTSRDRQTIMDINNDGLTDVCYVMNNTLMALINTGHGFSPNTLDNSYSNYLNSNLSYNVSGNISTSFPIWIFGVKIVVSPYVDASYNLSSQNYQLTDLNGDGFIDFAYVDGNDVKVNYGIPKKVNILKKVTTPTKSSYTLDYAMTYPTRNNPQSKWVYSSLMVYDGFNYDGQNTTYYKYAYDSAFYHRMERESFGFKTVKTMQYDNFSTSGICYRITEEKYHNDYYLFKGLKKYDVSKSGNNKYVETYYVWDRKEISTGKIIPADSAQCFGPFYPAISQEDKYFYEGQSAYQIHTKKTYRHTRFGNVREYKNYGDVAYTSDDFTATITYSYNIPSNLLAMVSQMDVYDISNNIMQRRTGAYNAYGRISTIGAFDGSSYANTDVSYDSYGNVLYIQFPQNTNGERLSYSYEYDLSVHTYPVSVTDYWGNTSNTTYDYKLGAPLIVTDLTGNEMHYTYYADGKLNTVTGPNEVLASIPYTIKCEYWDEQPYGTSRWAKTRHYDPINTSNEFVTVNFSDGMGRSIQSKQKATVNGVDRMVVSGRTDYDAYGRAYRTSLPTDQALGTELDFYNYTPTNFATTTFDVLDRPLDQTAFDNTTVNYSYRFGQDAFVITCFETIITDPNGISTSKYTSARGLNTSVTAPMSTITMFEYDPLGTLKQSTDPEGFVTLYNYDMLGRLTSREHPDAGTTSYTYDLAGNVLTTETQNLANNSQEIQYFYANCRLEHIEYPQNPEMNVFYEYGTPNSGNQTGRLVKQQDASGVQTFEYGNMGELIKNIHTFVVPNGNHYTFETNWDYDSWNRMKTIDYPDGEIVSYHYDNGGKLYSMDGDKNGQPYNYISEVKYNKYGSRSRIDYGNNTYAEYTYDPLNQRLVNLTSFENSGAIMQNIDYSYDNASNITVIQNTSDYVNGSLGGDYTYNYEYDDLYRLIGSAGYFQSAFSGSIGFNQSIIYSESGNILQKNLDAAEEIGGGIQNVNYSRKYEYNDRPHTVTETGDFKYEWDANGNQIHRSGLSDRQLCWDEENRLMAVHETGEQPTYSAYIYDAGGERAWKMASDVVAMYINGQGINYAELVKTLYVNPYMVVTEQEYSKHYYIEGERVCTKIGGGFGPGPNIPVDGELPLLQDDYETVRQELWEMTMRYVECTQGPGIAINENLEPCHNGEDNFEELQNFYHPDHLGSSSFITDAMGYATQHLQYLPFGETFVDQQNGYDSRYTFSAKEKDDETQYSYFGARYYDSDLSVWLSVDPMSDNYPNLSPYMYCAGNPVILIDPDGMDIEPTFYSGENGESSAVYAKGIIDQALDGQFESYLAKGQNGNAVLAIRPTEGGGDFSKMSESALAFYDELSTMINDHSTTAKIDVFYGNSEVRTGNYINNAIDVADMMQYNVDEGATRGGKMIHELSEQFAKAKDGVPKGSDDNRDRNHLIGIQSENHVNGNKRLLPDTKAGYGRYETKYERKDNSVFSVIITDEGGIIRVDQPRPQGTSYQKNRFKPLR